MNNLKKEYMTKVFDKYINRNLIRKYSREKTYKKAIFLDRDGVIIKDCHYIKDPSNVELEKNINNIIDLANNAGWLVIVVTNQSGISKGYLSWHDYHKVNKKMLSLIGKPNPFAAIYANSLSENNGKNNWRKPSPKMLYEAANDFSIKLKDSIIVGDRFSDIECGANASLRLGIHVLTGHGRKERQQVQDNIDANGYFRSENSNTKVEFIDDLRYFPENIFSKNKHF